MIRVKNIEDVVNYQLCTGCGACEAAEPNRYEMSDIEQFGMRPQLKKSASPSTGLAFSVCPGHNLTHDYNQKDVIRDLEDCWGPVLGVWEGFAVDDEIRNKGSSGGAATALSLFALEVDGSQGVLQTGASPVAHLNENKISETRDQLVQNSGSRYSPASPCVSLKGLTEKEGKYVFVGKPCDVAAVRNWERLDKKNEDKIAIRIGFFCAGTPSTKGNVELLKKNGVSNIANLLKLKFRGQGWPGLWKAEYRDQGEIKSSELTYADSWGFLQKFRQWRCYICPDHSGEFADIAVGDPWYREVSPGESGKSLIVVRTQRGMDFLNRAVEHNYITLESKNDSLLPRSQPNLIKSRGDIWARLFVLKAMGAAVPAYKGFRFFKFWLSELTIKNKFGSIYGTITRVKRKSLKKSQEII